MARAQRIEQHWSLVADEGCIVCLSQPATIHHCHGGSMREVGVFKVAGKKTSDWLVLPLCVLHHVGDMGIDSSMGVRRWEALLGSQVEYLRQLSKRLGYDVFEKAKEAA